MPTVTIGMPVYNGAATIRAALDSLCSQSFEDFVVVISDNASTDDTQAICREYVERDPRISYMRQPVNLGAAMNFRFVLFEAQTPFFMWAAADDLWAPSFIASHLAVLDGDPNVVASQSRVLFTVGGLVSHLANGTFPLPYDARRNATRFFRRPTDNCRYYSVFRTAALQAVFPNRNFYALDWAVSAATLRFGTHVELPDILMIRDCSDASSYERTVSVDHRSVLWRVFPILFMTKWVLTRRAVPFSPGLLYNLAKMNLHMHFRFVLYRWGRIAKRHVETNSVRSTLRLRMNEMIGAIVRPGLSQRAGAALRRMLHGLFAFAHRLWQAIPFTLRQREAIKRRTFRLLGRRVSALPSYAGWTTAGSPMSATDHSKAAPPPTLPASNWIMPRPLLGDRPAASVIIVVQNDLHSTLALINSLAVSQGVHPLEIVVVDNGSVDATVFLGGMCPTVTVVRLPQPVTYGEADMAGVTAATADRLIFVKQRLLVHPNFLSNILAGLDTADMVGPQSRYPDSRLRAAGGIATRDLGRSAIGRGESPSSPDHLFARQVDFCPAAFAIRREMLDKIGGFSQDYPSFAVASLGVALGVYAETGRVRYWPAAVVTDYSGHYDQDAGDYRLSQSCSRAWSAFVAEHELSIEGRAVPRGSGRRLPDRSRRKRLLYIDSKTPMPDQNSGSIDAVNLMRILGDLGFAVSFIPESDFVRRGQYSERLQALGVHVLYEPFYASVRQVLEKYHDEFDVILVCRADIIARYIDMIRTLAPRASLIFYTVDLHGLRALREAELSNDRVQLQAAQALWVSELDSAAKADATVVVSTYERALLARSVPKANIHVVPLIRDIPDRLECPGYAVRRDIMFVGTYQHRPNHDAAVFLAKEIWPGIHARLPDARCLLVGSCVTPEIQALAGNGVEVIGFVDDLESLLASCRLTVAPLRYGAGLKGKVASSLQAGVPVVATSIAVEGTTLVHESNVLVADTPEAFADAVIRLYTDQALWERLSLAGFAHAREEYSIEANVPRVHTLLESVGQADEAALTHRELAQADALYRSSAI